MLTCHVWVPKPSFTRVSPILTLSLLTPMPPSFSLLPLNAFAPPPSLK
uniref:Uncharacterized protein n=1 Tax=Rhizophora mucronata TaxID=61149 RepID=A0A2P2NME0_RHIMU